MRWPHVMAIVVVSALVGAALTLFIAQTDQESTDKVVEVPTEAVMPPKRVQPVTEDVAPSPIDAQPNPVTAASTADDQIAQLLAASGAQRGQAFARHRDR